MKINKIVTFTILRLLQYISHKMTPLGNASYRH